MQVVEVFPYREEDQSPKQWGGEILRNDILNLVDCLINLCEEK